MFALTCFIYLILFNGALPFRVSAVVVGAAELGRAAQW